MPLLNGPVPAGLVLYNQPPSMLPFSVLEAPEDIVAMLVDGELTARGVRLALFDPYRLSPAERSGIRERLSQNQPSIVDALLGVVLNPMTWFFLATAPLAAGSTLRLWGKRRGLSMFLRENGTALQRAGLTTATAELGESASLAALQTIRSVVQKYRDEVASGLGPHLEKILTRLQTDTLNWQQLTGDKAMRVRQYTTALWAYLSGVDKHWREPIITATTKRPHTKYSPRLIGNLGKKRIYRILVDRQPLIKESTESLLLRYGGQEGLAYAEAVREHILRATARELWGWNGQSVDPARAAAVLRAAKDPAFRQVVTRQLRSQGLVNFILDDNMIALVARANQGSIVSSTIREVTEEILKSPYYFPKRVADHVDLDGNVIQFPRGARAAPKPLRSASVIYRSPEGIPIHPQDIEFLFSMSPPTQQGIETLNRGRRALNRARDKGKTTTLFARINPDRALGRYVTESGAHLAITKDLNTMEGVTVLQANRRAFQEGLYEKPGPYGAAIGMKYGTSIKDGSELSTSIDDIYGYLKRGHQPIGGFTVLDALKPEVASMKNRFSLERLLQVYLPSALGFSPVRRSLVLDASLALREWTAGIMNSPLAVQAASMSKGLSSAREKVLQWATEDPTSSRVSQSIAEWLYGSHLAGNPGSVVLNLSQTLGPALTVFGIRSMAYGWSQAFRTIQEYVRRWRPGMSEYQRRELWESINLVAAQHARILTPIHDILESEVQRLWQQPPFWKRVIRAGMGPFQMVETFNRLSTFFAHVHKLHGKTPLSKVPVTTFLDAQRSVMEFQFPSEAINTPYLFQPGQLLGNPLMRQFGSFVIRSATLPFSTLPSLADGKRYWRWGKESKIPTPLFDFLRIVSLSTVTYEVGKALFGIDPTPYTGWAQITDAYPFISQGRFRADESILPFTPPVLDIPASVLMGLGTGDIQLLYRQAARLVPFGVPIMRAIERLGIRAEPGSTPGMLRVLTPEGTLLGEESVWKVVGRAMGLPVPEGDSPVLMAKWSAANAKEIGEYRSRAYDMLIQGDHVGLGKLQQHFSRRFKVVDPMTGQEYPMPLILTQEGLKARFRSLTEPLHQRVISDVYHPTAGGLRLEDLLRPQIR